MREIIQELANRFLTVKEAAKVLKTSEHTIRIYIGKGIIKSLKVGNAHLIPRKEVEKLLLIKENFYTLKDIQEKFGISRQQVYNWVKDGLLPEPVRVLKQAYFAPDKVDKFYETWIRKKKRKKQKGETKLENTAIR